jgi:hypothetical protein
MLDRKNHPIKNAAAKHGIVLEVVKLPEAKALLVYCWQDRR